MRNSLIDKPLKNKCNVLIVEDCKLFSDGVKMILSLIPKTKSFLKFNFDQALDYESALTKIKEARPKEGLDVVILDIRLGKIKDGERKSGEELGVFIRKYTPKTKIVVITSYSGGFRINSIVKNINPEGFFIKNYATNPKTFQEVMLKIINGETYYCNSVSEVLRKNNNIEFKIDANDLKILYELSIATKKKNMPKHIPLELRSIEKRHRRLREIFEVDSDRNLVLKAKENGLI